MADCKSFARLSLMIMTSFAGFKVLELTRSVDDKSVIYKLAYDL